MNVSKIIGGIAAVGGALKNFTAAQWYAAGRHALTSVGSVVVVIGLLSQGDWNTAVAIMQKLVTGFTQIGQGVETIAEALGAAAVLFSSLKAGSSASPVSQSQSLVNQGVISPLAIKDEKIAEKVTEKQ